MNGEDGFGGQQRALLGAWCIFLAAVAGTSSDIVSASTNSPISSAAQTSQVTASASQDLAKNGPHLPNGYFEENLGQAGPAVKFLAKQGLSHVAIDKTGITWSAQPIGYPNADQIRLTWLQANANEHAIEGIAATGGRTNYVLGNDPQKWILGARQYRMVRESGVFPGVDVVYRALQNEVRYDLEVQPGADPTAMRMVISGATSIALDADGALLVKRRGFEILSRSPVAYQDINGQRQSVNAAFRQLTDNTVSFDVGSYNRSYALVIDPTVVFSSFIGGSADDDAHAVGVAKTENLSDLVPGLARDTVTMLLGTESTNMPVVGPSSHYTSSTEEMFVAKLDGDGQALIYATYLGGSNDDVAEDLATDTKGNAYITGYSLSTDFPTLNAYQGTNYAASGGGWSAVLVMLGPRGTPVYSTFLGGGGYTFGTSVAADAGQNAVITGYTNSPGGTTIGTSFPLVAAAQSVNNGGEAGWDAFVARFNPSGQPVFSTFLGGDGDDEGYRVAYDLNSNVYTSGLTFSQTKFATANALQSICGSNSLPCNDTNGSDAYLAIHSGAGQLKYASFLGGTQTDAANAIAVYQPNLASNAEVTVGGYTQSPDFPTKNAFQASLLGTDNGFLTTFVVTPSFGTSEAASTFLGGSVLDTVYTLAADRWGNIYAGGMTESSNFPLVNPLQSTVAGTDKGFVAVFQSPVAATNGQPGSPLRFSTLIGGSGNNYVNGIVPDDIPTSIYSSPYPGFSDAGGMYVAVGTTSPNFPMQRPVVQGSYNGGIDHGGFEGIIAKIGLCNHMNAVPAEPTFLPVNMVAIAQGPVNNSPADQRLYYIDQAMEESKRLAKENAQESIDPSADRSISTLENQSNQENSKTKQSIRVQWNRAFGTVFSIHFDNPLNLNDAANETNTQRARQFILEHPEFFRLTHKALDNFEAFPDYPDHGQQTIRLVQKFGGIPFFNSQSGITILLTADGRIVSAGGSFYPQEEPPQTQPKLDLSKAYAAMRQHLPNLWRTADGRPSPHDGASGPVTFEPITVPMPRADPKVAYTRIRHVGMDFTNALRANLVYYLVGRQLHLGWQFTSAEPATSEGYADNVNESIEGVDVVIDSDTGEVLFAQVHRSADRVVNMAQSDVLNPRNPFALTGVRQGDPEVSTPAAPLASITTNAGPSPQGTIFTPNPDGGTTTQSFAGDPTASPDGWLDQFASVFYTLGGNNTCVEDRRYAQPTPGGSNPYSVDQNWRAYSSLSATGEFLYSFGNAYRTSGGTDLNTDIDATLTNAFYWVNYAHDHFYALGFDEKHRNFQRRNIERDPTTGITLGQADDEVQVFVHFSANNFKENNAGFQKAPEGFRPNLQLFAGTPTSGGFTTSLFTDVALDGQAILHEYTHGVTSRLVGNNTTSGLVDSTGTYYQVRALDEGYSDFFAGSITNNPVIGEYLNGNATYGIRAFALNQNPLTLANFCNPAPCQAYVNELIWSSALWDFRSLLRQSYGAQGGTQLAEQVVINGLLNMTNGDTTLAVPFEPNIIEARVATLDAALATSPIVKRFADFALACRGIGANATTTGITDTTPVPDFTLSDGTKCSGLSIYGTGTPNPVVVQSDLTYSIIVTNGSPVPNATGPQSTSTQVSFTLPDGAANVSANPSQGSCGSPAGSTLTCSLGTLAYGAQVDIGLTVTPQKPEVITLTAVVTGDIGGPNQGQPTTTVSTTVCVPDLVFRNGFETTNPTVKCQ